MYLCLCGHVRSKKSFETLHAEVAHFIRTVNDLVDALQRQVSRITIHIHILLLQGIH
jgi:adenosine/AMP kinase